MKRKIIFCITVIVLAVTFCINALCASGSSYISVSSSSLEVGDTLTVTVNVSSSGEYLFGLDGSLSYNSSVLEFVSGTSANGGGGSISIYEVAASEDENFMSFEIIFEAISEGNSGLSFRADTYNPNMEAFTTSGCSTNIEVTEAENEIIEDTYEESNENDTSEEEETENEKPKEEELFVTINNEQYKIWQDFEGVELPNGFGPYIFEYQNRQAKGAVDSSGCVRIACLENQNTKEKDFYLYFEGNFYPYIPVSAVFSEYTLFPLEEGLEVPEIFDIRIDNFMGGSLPVWASSNESLKGRYLIYATSPEGERGFFLYDEKYETVQTFIQVNYENSEPVKEPVPVETEPLSLGERIAADREIFLTVVLLGAICIALVITCIVIIISAGGKNKGEKFRKKINKKEQKFLEKQKKQEKPFSNTAEIIIETDNFDNMKDE